MGVFGALRLSGSALQAERTRMDVIAENIANVETTRAGDGEPYRRRQVVLRTFQVGRAPGGESLAGVRVADLEPDLSPLPRLHNPSHPDADPDGYVLMPNVDLPTEMADMVLAARAYEANAAAFKSGREIIRQALSILA
ncbi:MAG: flagellar basal body rod protein FlgC [Armatimonadota bacterium]|nr:flagellar basal body rod protein FlgC [Armatimonadota bacterium]